MTAAHFTCNTHLGNAAPRIWAQFSGSASSVLTWLHDNISNTQSINQQKCCAWPHMHCQLFALSNMLLQ